MSNKATVCRVVLDDVSIHEDALADRTGIAPRVLAALLTALCREGALRRTGEYIAVGIKARCEAIAESDGNGSASPPVAHSPTQASMPAPKRAAAVALPPTFTIDKGVPLQPVRGRGAGRAIKFPFAQMEVGDSFSVPVPDGADAKHLAKSIALDLSAYRKRCGTFHSAIRVEPTGKTVRCWRLAESISPRRPKPNGAAHVTKRGKSTIPGKALL